MAIREEHTVVIDRPVEEVFAFATDPNNDSLWQSTTLETEQTSEGAVDVGTTFRNGSTRFTQTFEAEVGGFFRLAEPVVGRAIRRQMEADMATLKDLLEAGEPEGG
jgi:hypothetical protein